MKIDPSIATRYVVAVSSDPGSERHYIDHGIDGRWDVTHYVTWDGVEHLKYGKRDPVTGGYAEKWFLITGERS